MPEKSSILADVKSKQYLLICKAGLAVPSFEMSAEQIYDAMMKQFKFHVEQFKMPANFTGLPKERFFRTANHLIEKASPKDMHTGMSLWRKFGSIKKYILSVLTPILNKNLGPDSLPPSGKSMENVLFSTRQHVYEKEQQESKLKSKNPSVYVMKPFKISWYPVEWECFLAFGKPAAKPEKGFSHK
jgi:hypothetical protein